MFGILRPLFDSMAEMRRFAIFISGIFLATSRMGWAAPITDVPIPFSPCAAILSPSALLDSLPGLEPQILETVVSPLILDGSSAGNLFSAVGERLSEEPRAHGSSNAREGATFFSSGLTLLAIGIASRFLSAPGKTRQSPLKSKSHVVRSGVPLTHLGTPTRPFR